jgi:chromate reductase
MSDVNDVTMVGLCGSLRRGSFNRELLRVAQEVAPPGVSLVVAEIGEIPPYDDDVRAAGYPPSVHALREAVRAADAVLFSTPEYNYSVPGVLKNALDWASRPPDQPFAGKAAAVMGTSIGSFGASRAQYHLRQIGVYMDLHFINKPEVIIPLAREKFDAEGKLTFEPARELIRQQLVALRAWALQLRK